MSNPLKLRPVPYIVAGYLLGPLVGLTALWLLWILPTTNPLSALAIWSAIVFVGGVICLAVELLVVTPILVGFRHYRWSWTNGWTACAIGIALGALASLAWGLKDANTNYRGYSEYGQNGVAYFIDGIRTTAGWRAYWQGLVYSTLGAGLVGGLAAIVFRLVAVEDTSKPQGLAEMLPPDC